ncbi:MAG: GNAT family N-acetyltransferase, partial [Candidatus Thorarchaeota archaeon]
DYEYRRKGIGRALIQKVIDEFQKAGADRILLTCPAEAAEAMNLYDSFGFEVRAYHMKLDLTRSE